jgi:RNA polymerase sigma-70 factor (ECF subfamily)
MSSPTQTEIDRLITEARAGDRRSIGSLIDLYRNYLQLIAQVRMHRCLQSRLNPSDVIQEAMIKAWNNFGQFHGKTESELMAWLRSIVLHAIKSAVEHEIKTAKRSIRREVPLDKILAELDSSARQIAAVIVSPISSPSDQAERRELAVIVADRIARLPENYRELVVLRNLEGASFEEIAARFGKSVGAVRAMWARAVVKLHEIAAELEQP